MTDQPATDQPESDQPVSDEPVSDEAELSTVESELSTVESADRIPAPTATAVLTHVVRSIVDDADAVHVDAVEGRNRLKLEVKVGPGDLGRVIGRRGRTAQSIRTVVRAAATRDGVEVDVDFVD
ncbi:MAG: uncharacterized protein QOJ66_892 [Ilumatobacteraceae bacterium]